MAFSEGGLGETALSQAALTPGATSTNKGKTDSTGKRRRRRRPCEAASKSGFPQKNLLKEALI